MSVIKSDVDNSIRAYAITPDDKSMNPIMIQIGCGLGTKNLAGKKEYYIRVLSEDTEQRKKIASIFREMEPQGLLKQTSMYDNQQVEHGQYNYVIEALMAGDRIAKFNQLDFFHALAQGLNEKGVCSNKDALAVVAMEMAAREAENSYSLPSL